MSTRAVPSYYDRVESGRMSGPPMQVDVVPLDANETVDTILLNFRSMEHKALRKELESQGDEVPQAVVEKFPEFRPIALTLSDAHMLTRDLLRHLARAIKSDLPS